MERGEFAMYPYFTEQILFSLCIYHMDIFVNILFIHEAMFLL